MKEFTENYKEYGVVIAVSIFIFTYLWKCFIKHIVSEYKLYNKEKEILKELHCFSTVDNIEACGLKNTSNILSLEKQKGCFNNEIKELNTYGLLMVKLYSLKNSKSEEIIKLREEYNNLLATFKVKSLYQRLKDYKNEYLK